jgi:glycerophosphoryl diester phosphodiesterase
MTPKDATSFLFSVLIVFMVLQTVYPVWDKAEDSSVMVIAHRGGLFEAIPENTISAFKMAIKAGADIIEVDLRNSQDGHVMIMHDPILDRTTNGRGNIGDYPLEMLKMLDAGKGEKIPTYEEVLELIGDSGVKLLLDIKKSPLLDIKKVVDLTEHYGHTHGVIAGVRSLEDLKAIKKLNPDIRTIGFISSPDQIKAFVNSGADIIRLFPVWIKENPQIVEDIRKINIPVWVTASDLTPDEFKDLVSHGVTGFITDYPAKFKLLLESKNGE